MLLSAEHISKNYGTRQLLDDVSLYLGDRERMGIIGINGAGKSTLLRILAGVEQPDGGTVITQRNIRIAYLPQNPVMDDSATVLEQAFSGFSAQFREINEYEVRTMLTRLGITEHDALVGTLSGGQKKRVALAETLIHPADILVLDEPTNHLDIDMVGWLEDRLRSYGGGIIMVTHDRYLLERITGRITELSRGRLYTYEANYSRYLELRAQRLDMEEASERKRQAILRHEYQWIMRGAKARSTKSRGRIDRYNALREQDAPERDESVKLASVSSRLGKKLIELHDVSKSYNGRDIISNFSYNVKRDDRIGIVGRNGAGKTTLLNLISGRLAPDTGAVETGSTVITGYFTQEGKELDPGERVYDFIRNISDEVKTDEGTFSASQLLERFLFTSDMQYSPIGKLSGGERRRLFLLSILVTAPNILLLDEPTNDLDIETLMILEDYLESFPGAVISVSHDRYFLDKTVSSIFEVADGGSIAIYNGGYSDYIEKRPEELREKQPEKTPARQERTAPVRREKLKMSFKEQREFETIDADIEGLEADIKTCQEESRVASSDYVRLMELTERLDGLKKALDEKTERWLYLNELAEKIEAQNGKK